MQKILQEINFVKKKKMGNATKSLPEQDIRKYGVRYWPSFHPTRGTCKYPGCTGKKHMYCLKCNVHLCYDGDNN